MSVLLGGHGDGGMRGGGNRGIGGQAGLHFLLEGCDRRRVENVLRMERINQYRC